MKIVHRPLSSTMGDECKDDPPDLKGAWANCMARKARLGNQRITSIGLNWITRIQTNINGLDDNGVKYKFAFKGGWRKL